MELAMAKHRVTLGEDSPNNCKTTEMVFVLSIMVGLKGMIGLKKYKGKSKQNDNMYIILRLLMGSETMLNNRNISKPKNLVEKVKLRNTSQLLNILIQMI